jgi:hypothetical protein
VSIYVMSWVLEHSATKLGDRLTLIALADNAHDDGRWACPSVDTLARKTGMHERTVQRTLRNLAASGHIAQVGQTKDGRNVYTLIGPFNRGGDKSPGVASDARGGGTAPPKPSKRTVSSSSSVSEPDMRLLDEPATPRLLSEVGGQEVTREEYALAVQALGAFNEAADRNFSGKDWLAAIIRRQRERPELTLERHREAVRATFNGRRWWKGDPHPGLVWGSGKAFDMALNRVRKRDDDRVSYNRPG